jgi:hypothetical protein
VYIMCVCEHPHGVQVRKKEFVGSTSGEIERRASLLSVGGADFDAICIAIVFLLAQLVRLHIEKFCL